VQTVVRHARCSVLIARTTQNARYRIAEDDRSPGRRPSRVA
jgi:hypothetical protein